MFSDPPPNLGDGFSRKSGWLESGSNAFIIVGSNRIACLIDPYWMIIQDLLEDFS